MSEQKRQIGLRLRKERQRLGLSQNELGNRGGVEANAQGRYENGIRAPNATYFMAVADLGIDLLFVLTGVKTVTAAKDLSPAERDLMIKFRSLLLEDQNAIMQVMGTIAKLLELTLDGKTTAVNGNNLLRKNPELT